MGRREERRKGAGAKDMVVGKGNEGGRRRERKRGQERGKDGTILYNKR